MNLLPEKKIGFILLGFMAMAIIVYACRKAKHSEDAITSTEVLNKPLSSGCTNSPDYGDSVICPKFRGPNQDYTIMPRNNQAVNGKYYSWPEGLILDTITGEINVTKSETGSRFIVGFVKDGTQDTCKSTLILAGMTYLDSIYVLDQNDTLAIPYFNANPVITSICDPGDDNDYPTPGNGNGGGNNKCEFDDGDDDDNGNGQADEPPPGQRANDQKVRVRTKSGVINLKKTLEDGAFGPNPQNGDSKTVNVYYRLNDCSKKALQMIRVKLIYYEKVSDIPAATVNQIRDRRTAFYDYATITPDGKPRPPQIIITRAFE